MRYFLSLTYAFLLVFSIISISSAECVKSDDIYAVVSVTNDEWSFVCETTSKTEADDVLKAQTISGCWISNHSTNNSFIIFCPSITVSTDKEK